MTLAALGILLLIVVPLALLVLDVVRGRAADTVARETVLKRGAGRAVVATGVAAPQPQPAADPARNLAFATAPAIRPGEGMVYRGPSAGAGR